MQSFDYIISGSGASGLMLAYQLAKDSFFDEKSILIIDKEEKKNNDRTWSYWSDGDTIWNHLAVKAWKNINFYSEKFSLETEIAPYQYYTIRSGDFYKEIYDFIKTKSNFTFTFEKVLNINHRSDFATVLTNKNQYRGAKVFNSILFNKFYNQQKKYPVLQQHFIGWFVKTKENQFDDTAVTFMDFDIPQKNNTRFMYILPFSRKEALFEYTLFSESLLGKKEYEGAIKDYLEKKGIKNYEIVEKEQGSIPMTCYKFWAHNSKNVLQIGISGGWAKASTGYTFKNSIEKSKELVDFIKKEDDLRLFHKPKNHWFYDLLFLDVLSKQNYRGSELFTAFFKKNRIQQIFKFLDEKTTISEDIRLMSHMPIITFTIALFKRLLKKMTTRR